MTIDSKHDDFEPHHNSSPTDHVLHELQLHGYRPFQDEPDPRPLPEAKVLAGTSPIFSMLWYLHYRTPVSNPTSRTCSGRR
jgi:hypothetical protein